MSRRPTHDASFRQLFSHAVLVEHLLRGFIDESWVAQLDFTRLEPVDTQVISERLDERRHDLVWRVALHEANAAATGPRWLYLYLLMEFQSRDDPWMALRMHTYVGLLCQALVRAGQLQVADGLPPVFPLVIHHGSRPWRAAQDLRALFQAPQHLSAYLPQQRYHVLDLGMVSPDPERLPDNLAAALIALEQTQDVHALRGHVQWLLRILHHPHHDSLRRAFMTYLRRSLLKRLVPEENVYELNDLEEVDAMLAAKVTLWTRQWKREGMEEGRQEGRKVGLQEGLQEGRREGRQEGQSDLLQQLLEQRFGPLPDDVRSRLQQASVAELQVWASRLMTAPTLAAVLDVT